MEQYICIAATFLVGRYHGVEWPPSPARLFQALLAGARTGSYRQQWSAAESALRLLEALPAPEIVVRDFETRTSYRIAVPNNDSDKAGREWSAGRPFDLATTRTMKSVIPREVQDRTKSGPHVYYLWKVSAENPAIHAVWQTATFLHTFGWGIDMAYADSFVLDEDGRRALASNSELWLYSPGEQGDLRDVPALGYFDDLLQAYSRSCNRLSKYGVDPSIRSIKHGQCRYRRAGSPVNPSARFLLRRLDDSDKPYAVPWALGMKVAAWMRSAAKEALREEGYKEEFINSYILGHGHGHGRHVSFVPVPTIRAGAADGAVRRVMLVEPADADGKVTALLQQKLAPSELMMLTNGGPPKPVCSLAEVPRDDSVFLRYCNASKPSKRWHSVTPVVLHGYNSEHRKFSLKKTEQLLYQAFEESGYAKQSIAELCFQAAPFWPGTEGATAIRVPQHLRQWPRYHVAVRFSTPLNGPVLVGIGRHYGIGLFAAPWSQGG
ncbi:MAG: type I-U CRISPR-associated protein Csb2 [Acidobacteriaceae bacterium]